MKRHAESIDGAQLIVKNGMRSDRGRVLFSRRDFAAETEGGSVTICMPLRL